MMTTINEQAHDSEFVLAEDSSFRSRDVGIIASGQNLRAGTVLSLGSDGKYTAYAGDATLPAAVLYTSTNATDADAKATIVVRNAEVAGQLLIWPTGFTSQQIRNAVQVLQEAGVEVR